MKINSLKVKNFKKFSDLEVEFEPGLNIVIGPNEAGKSTISHAIIESLYSDPATRSKQFLDRVYPWGGSKNISLQLDFEADGVNFNLKKDFNKKDINLENKDTGKKTDSYKAVQQVLSKLTGISTRNIYESTAFVGQSDITSIDNSDDLVASIHKVALSTNTKVSVQEVVSKINSELRKMRVGIDRPAKNPGVLKVLQDELDHLKNELEEKTEQWKAVNSEAFIEKETNTRLTEVNDRIEQIELLINNNKQLKRSKEKYAVVDTDLQKQLGKKIQVNELLKQKDGLEEQMTAFANLSKLNLEETTRKITRFAESEQLIKQEVEKVKSTKDQYKTITVNDEDSEFNWVNMIVLNVVFLAFGGAMAVFFKSLLFVTVGIGLSGVFSEAMLLRILRNKKKKNITKKETITEYDFTLNRLTSQLHEIQENMQKILSDLNVQSAEDFFVAKANYQAIYERLNEVNAQLKGVLQGETVEAIAQNEVRLLKLKREIEINDLTDEVKNSELTPGEYLQTTRELDTLYLEKKKIEEQHTTARVRVEDAQVSTDDLVLLEEKMERAMESKAYYSKHEEALELALKALNEAMEDTASAANKVVSVEIEKYLQKLTRSVYKNARLTKALEVEVFSDEKNDWIDPVGRLSKGTVDQICFLTRIAFLKILLKDKSVPIILDDPFVTFDTKRKEGVREILQELAKDFQIILLTHDSTYESWGNNITLNIEGVQKKMIKS